MASARRRVVIWGVSVAVVLVTFFVVLPRIADYGDVWRVLQSMTLAELVLLAALDALNVATYGPTWMAAMPGLSYWQSTVLTMSATAVTNVAPVGAAVSFGVTYDMLRRWGFKRGPVTRAVVVTGVWNQAVNIAFPLVAIALLGLSGDRNRALEAGAVLGVGFLVVVTGAFALIFRSDDGARQVGRVWDRTINAVVCRIRHRPAPASANALIEFRHESLALLRRRWLALTATTTIGTFTVFFVMLAALRTAGVTSGDVSNLEAFTAWSFGRMLAAIAFTPGGLGIVEVGITAMLSGFGGERAAVVAGVLIFRFLTLVPPIVLGAVFLLGWHPARRAPRPGAGG